jgi:CMD domain protein
MTTDIIDRLAGIQPGSRVDALRQRRGQTRDNAQASYEAIFVAPDVTGVTSTERLAVATFVAAAHGVPGVYEHYRALLAQEAGDDRAVVVDGLAAEAAGEGPYGRFPRTTDLRDEDAPGPVFTMDAATADVLGGRLAAALTHAHLLVFRPREASPEALAALADAGWNPSEIVTLSQLVAFLSFQIRVVDGLATLKETLS